METPSSPPAPPALALGSRVRPSPFFEATRRWGCAAYTTYNHFYMPAVFESVEADYRHLTEGVTLWDVGGERQTQVSGRDAAAFVQYLTPRDLAGCAPGRCRYVLVTNECGGVINDPVLLRLREDVFWLSAADSDLHLWVRGVALHAGFEVRVETPDVSPLQLQGPRALEVARAVFGEWVAEMRYFSLREFEFEGMPLVISRTGWSGEFGYEIYLRDGAFGDALWERMMAAGAPFGIRPACPSAVRRMEAGLLSYGADANGDDTPFHLGLERLAAVDGTFDFVGKDALRRVAAEGVTRRLVGVRVGGAPLAAPLVRWWDVWAGGEAGARVGKVRSAVFSHRLGRNIGLAMVDKPHCEVGTALAVRDEDGTVREAEVAALPFVPHRTR